MRIKDGKCVKISEIKGIDKDKRTILLVSKLHILIS